MIEIADRTILLADASKFGIRAFAHIAAMEQIDSVISNSSLDPSMAEALNEKNIKLRTV